MQQLKPHGISIEVFLLFLKRTDITHKSRSTQPIDKHRQKARLLRDRSRNIKNPNYKRLKSHTFIQEFIRNSDTIYVHCLVPQDTTPQHLMHATEQYTYRYG